MDEREMARTERTSVRIECPHRHAPDYSSEMTLAQMVCCDDAKVLKSTVIEYRGVEERDEQVEREGREYRVEQAAEEAARLRSIANFWAGLTPEQQLGMAQLGAQR